ncbi:hypothetical protein ACFS07_28680 [Undibacterium arcticum]
MHQRHAQPWIVFFLGRCSHLGGGWRSGWSHQLRLGLVGCRWARFGHGRLFVVWFDVWRG